MGSAGDGVGAAAVLAGEEAFVLIFHEAEPPATRAEDEPDASADIRVGDIEFRLGDGFLRRGECQRDDARQSLQVAGIQLGRRIEVVSGNRTDATGPFAKAGLWSLKSAGAVEAGGAEGVASDAVGRDAADAGDEGPRVQRGDVKRARLGTRTRGPSRTAKATDAWRCRPGLVAGRRSLAWRLWPP